MKGHGGEKWRAAAFESLETAKHLNATTKDYRTVYFKAGAAVEMLMVAIGIKQRQLLDVPGNERGGHWHNLPYLASRNGCMAPLLAAMEQDKLLRDAWLVLKDWESDGRFPTTALNLQTALDMLNSSVRIFGWLLNRYETI